MVYLKSEKERRQEMLDGEEVKEFVDKQNHIIQNLIELVRIITYKERVKDIAFSNSVRDIVDQIVSNSYEAGPEGETWISWKKKPVKLSIECFCKVLNIDSALFNIESRY